MKQHIGTGRLQRSGWPGSRTARWGAFLLYIAAVISHAGAQEPKPTTSPAAAAAEEQSPAGEPSAPAPAGPIEYVGPDTYILLDAEGRPQPVPGMTYEDFMAAWKRLQQADPPNRQPRYVIEDIEFTGQALQGHADLKFNAVVRVLANEAVEVPLGLSGAILHGEPRFDRQASSSQPTGADGAGRSSEAGKPAEAYLDFDAEQGGFIARFSGAAGLSYTVSMTLLVPLSRDGLETVLAMTCPRTVSSKLILDIGAAITEAGVSGGTLVSQAASAGGTQLVAAGLTGTFRLTWQTSHSPASELSPVLNAEGAIRLAIDGRSVQTDARLTVRSYGGSFDQFRVRLPPGAQLIPRREPNTEEQSPPYRITLERPPDGEATEAAARQPQIVLVQLPEKQQGPVVVDLSTEQPIGLGDADLAAELAGFEVLGAVRQFGDVALHVADDWQARWELRRFVRQVDPDELDPHLEEPGLTAAFQYDRQPWSLNVGVAARNLRVHVTPQYEMECAGDEARLAVHLAYQVLGARAFEFRVMLNNWELGPDPVESGGLVDRDAVHVTSEGILVLPLTQASSRRADISFTVKHTLPRDAQSIELPVPVPLADSVGSGELVVDAAADIELLPDTMRSTGLTPTPLVEPLDDVDATIAGTEYRYRTTVPNPMFVADRIRRTREVTTDVATHIAMEGSGARVTQQIDYGVRYEALKELLFEVPQEFDVEGSQTEISLVPLNASQREARREVPLSVVPLYDEELMGMDPTREVRAPLPQPRLGRFAVRIEYLVPAPLDDRGEVAWQVPLFSAVDGETIGHSATVESQRRLSVALDSDAEGSTWTAITRSDSPASAASPGSPYEFVAAEPETALPLVVRAMPQDPAATTTVERVWLQTWLAGAMRQDRAAFRFRTTGTQVAVELPPQRAPVEIEVLVDGRPADVVLRAAGRLVVTLNDAESHETEGQLPAARTLELRYRQPASYALITRRRLTPPQVVGNTALSELYWQIVMPADRHILRSPSQLASASVWQWWAGFWGQRPTMSQAELEKWIGASQQLAPSTAQNQYLYAGLAPLSSIEVVTAPRWLIVLAASGSVLGLVLTWIYVPFLRRGSMLLALAGLLAGLALAFPTAALLLAQASLLGIVLSALALFIWRLAMRPARWSVVVQGGSSLRQATPRAESILIAPIAAGASTTPTASLSVPDSER